MCFGASLVYYDELCVFINYRSGHLESQLSNMGLLTYLSVWIKICNSRPFHIVGPHFYALLSTVQRSFLSLYSSQTNTNTFALLLPKRESERKKKLMTCTAEEQMSRLLCYKEREERKKNKKRPEGNNLFQRRHNFETKGN